MSQTIATRRRRQLRLRPQTILNLAVFLVVLIGLAIYYRPPRPIVPSIDPSTATMTNEAVPVPTVLEVRADDLSQVVFRRGDVAFTVAYDGEHWAITAPFNDRADDNLIAHFISNVAGIAFDEVIAEPEADAAYGLDAPVIRATLTGRDGKVYTLAIGQPEGAVEWYVKAADGETETVYLVRNLPEQLFSVMAGELIYGRLLDFNPADVRRITAMTPDGEVKVIEWEDVAWFTDTEYGRALVFDVDLFLRDLYGLTGSSIAATAEENAWDRLGLAPQPQTMKVELELADGSTHWLEVGGTTADGRRYYVRSSDRPHAYIVVEFSALNLYRKLQQASSEILLLNLDRVVEVSATIVNSDGTEVTRTFTRPNDKPYMWQSERRVAFFVRDWLETVNGVTTLRRAPDASAATYGLYPAPGSLRVTVTLDNKAKYTLDLGNVTSDGQYTYVQSSTRQGVYMAAAEAVEAIRTGLNGIRTRLVPFDESKLSEIEVITVAANGTETSQVLRKVNGTWMRGDNTAANPTSVSTLLTRLRDLQGEDVPPVVSEEKYGFYPAPNSFRVVLRSTDGAERILDIGAAVTSGQGWFTTTNYYVRVDDLKEVVFISDRANRDLRNAANDVFK